MLRYVRRTVLQWSRTGGGLTEVAHEAKGDRPDCEVLVRIDKASKIRMLRLDASYRSREVGQYVTLEQGILEAVCESKSRDVKYLKPQAGAAKRAEITDFSGGTGYL